MDERSKKLILSRCSLVLATTGAQLFLTSRWSRVLRCFLRMWFIFSMVFLGEFVVREVTAGGFSWQILISISFLVGNVVCNALLIHKRAKLESFITKLTEHVTSSDARLLPRKVNLLFAFFVSQMAINFVYGIFQLQKFNPHEDLVIGYLLATASSCTSFWTLTTCIFYWTVFQLMLASHKGEMVGMIRVSSGKHVDREDICRVISSIRDSVDIFEQLLSPLPFVWFLHGMISSAGVIYGLISNPFDFLNVLFTMHEYIPPLVVVISVCHGIQKLRKRAATINRLLTVNKALSSGDKILLWLELDRLKSLKLTGMSFFTMDKTFVVSYTGWALTFAALMAGFTKQRMSPGTDPNVEDLPIVQSNRTS